VGNDWGGEGKPTFDGRVIFFDKMVLDKPNRQSGLAHSCLRRRNPRERDTHTHNPSELHPRKHVSGEEEREMTPLTTAADENELVFA